MDARRPHIVYLTEAGAETAAKAAGAVNGVVDAPQRLVAPGLPSFDDAAEHLRALFAAGRPIIGVCAAGVLVRALAPLLGDKHVEPPVIAVASDGSAVVPLLGGHRGANALAGRLSEALGVRAAVTTASEAVHGVALDTPPPGWRLEHPDALKPFLAATLDGASITFDGGAGTEPWFEEAAAAFRATRMERRGEAGWRGTFTAGAASARAPVELTYVAQRYAVGVGCARGCSAEELAALVDAALAEARIPAAAVAGVFSIDVKSDEGAIAVLAERLGAPLRFFEPERLLAETERLATPSAVVFAEVGCYGVAEGAALAATGRDGRLVVEKRKSRNATVAIAEAPAPVTEVPGRRRGRLSVIGIGPGQADWRTPEASRLIAEAEELVGYGLYIDLLGSLAQGKARADFPLGGEEDRCRYALEQAGAGRDIALVCSGDAGIYAMGALVMELLARGEGPGGVSAAARRAAVVMAPGITALQAASARVGALIGHDFCAISLSDLLTPRDDIIRRLEAAAAGDFVIALYNPVSKRRRTLLAEARERLHAHRTAETPVLLAQNLGRVDERLLARTLETLDVDEVDMLTVVLIGSSASRCFATGDGGWRMFTPRGYAAKLLERAAAP